MENTSQISIGLIKTCFESEHYPKLFCGKDTHDPALRFVGQLVHYIQDKAFISDLVSSGLPKNYDGNTLKEVDRMIDDALDKGFAEPAAEKNSAATNLLKLVLNHSGVELFYDSSKTAYISIRENSKGKFFYRLTSEPVKFWLRKLYFGKFKKSPSAQAISDTVANLQANAIFGGVEKPVYLRVAKYEGSIVVNLANDMGLAVVINEDGYEITKSSPVAFLNLSTSKPLPQPAETTGPVLKQFQELAGLETKNLYRVLAFILNCLKPNGPYYFLLLQGEQGSGKSFLSWLIKMMIDPTQAPKLRPPRDERDLMIQASNNHILTFDNISGFKAEISDVLCSLSTGGGFSTRKLYTDDDAKVFEECRPYILNGINGVATRPDLLERAISIKLPSMKEGQRKTEEEMISQFNELHPYLLGKLFTAVSHALRNSKSVITPKSIRMADAAKWLIAAEEGLGLEEGTFQHALETSQQEVIDEAMNNNPLVVALMICIKDRPFEGTLGELHLQLKDDPNTFGRNLPPTSAHLSRDLERLRPALKKAGIEVEFGKKTRMGRLVRVWFSEDGNFEEAKQKKSDYSIFKFERDDQ